MRKKVVEVAVAVTLLGMAVACVPKDARLTREQVEDAFARRARRTKDAAPENGERARESHRYPSPFRDEREVDYVVNYEEKLDGNERVTTELASTAVLEARGNSVWAVVRRTAGTQRVVFLDGMRVEIGDKKST